MTDTSLSGRVAIVTGAAGQIGAAIAHRYMSAGCRIAALDLDMAVLRTCYPGYSDPSDATTVVSPTASSSAAEGPLLIACDVSDAQATHDAVAAVVKHWGTLHIVVNNAAVVTPSDRIGDICLADWQSALDVNVTGAWLISKWAIPFMAAAGGGVVLNMASQLGHVTAPGRGAYGVSKAALVALTRSIAVDHAAQGIRAVSLSPGAIQTSRVMTRYGSVQAANDKLAGRYPLQRIGTVEEVSEAALFLVGSGASFITGTDLLVDGGYTAL